MLFRFWIVLILASLSALVVRAQHLDKIYAALNGGDYATTKMILDRASENMVEPALQFALARYYFERDNPARQIDSAKKYVRLAQQGIGLVEKKSQVKKYHALGIRMHHVKELNTRIDIEAFETAERHNTVAGWSHFLALYPDAPQFSEAKTRRNRLAFLEARDKYDLTSFEKFLSDYPDAAEAGQARELYDRMLYLKQTRDSTWQAFEQFVNTNPDNPHREEARRNYERLLYADVTKDGSAGSYATFISKYPNSPYRSQAEDSLYRKSTRPATVKNLEAFIRRYTDSPHLSEAWNKLYVLSAVDGTNATILKFLAAHPSYPFVSEALRDTAFNNKTYVAYETEDGLVGYKDSTSNEILIEPVFWELSEFSEGFAYGTRDNCNASNCAYAYYDKAGRERISPRFSEASLFNHGVAIVAVGDCSNDSCLYGVIDRTGEYVVYPKYDAILPFKYNLALARLDSLYGFLNRDGGVAIPFIYKDANAFSEGLASVFDTSWKVIDTAGNILFDGAFKAIGSFGEGLCAAADSTGIWGYVDRSGNWIIKPQYLAAEVFQNGVAKVYVDASKKPGSVKLPKEKFINVQGKTVTAP